MISVTANIVFTWRQDRGITSFTYKNTILKIKGKWSFGWSLPPSSPNPPDPHTTPLGPTTHLWMPRCGAACVPCYCPCVPRSSASAPRSGRGAAVMGVGTRCCRPRRCAWWALPGEIHLTKDKGHTSRQRRVWTRAVIFRLFQKTVILPPNPVGFRLTYTQLWDIFFIRYVSICLN